MIEPMAPFVISMFFFPSLGLVQMNENKIAPIFILVTFVRYTCVFSLNTRTV